MSDLDQWIPQIGRIHIEAKKALKRSDEQEPSYKVPGAIRYATQFNELLNKISEENPSDPVIDSIEPIKGKNEKTPINRKSREMVNKNGDSIMNEIILNSGRLIDHLGYTIPEDQLIKSNSNATIIQMEQTNQQEQTASFSANVSIESTMESIEHSRTTPAKKKELEDIVEEFEAELSKEEPDQSRIRQFIQTAADKSTDIGAKLLMIALYHGIFQAAPLLNKV